MASTGTTTTGTSGAGWTTILANIPAPNRFVIRNNGNADGWFQLVGATSGNAYVGPRYFAAGEVWEVPGPMGSANEKHNLQIQNATSANMTGVSADTM